MSVPPPLCAASPVEPALPCIGYPRRRRLGVYVLILPLLAALGCHTSEVEEAAAEAHDNLDSSNDPANALVSVPVAAGNPWRRTWGSLRDNVDLAAWFAPCGVAPGLQIDATLLVRAGEYPWTILETAGAPLDACVTDRLRRLPVSAPLAEGERVVWLVRYRGGDTSPALLTAADDPGARALDGVPPSPPPPYVLYRKQGGIAWDHVRFEQGDVTWAQSSGNELDLLMPPPEALARRLSCPGDTLTAVRVVIEVERGDIVDVLTAPQNDCVAGHVEEAAADVRAVAVATSGGTVADLASAMLVFDVPVGSW